MRPPVQDSTKQRLQRLGAEMAQRRSRSYNEDSRDFFARSFHWLLGIKKPSHIPQRLECLEECVKFFYYVADRPSMTRTVAALTELASKASIREWDRKAHTYCAIAAAELGDLHQALTSYSKALVIARDLDDASAQVTVLSNIGTALMFAGLYTDAARALERALDIGLSNARLATMGCYAATNMGQVCARLGHYESGVRYLEKALTLEKDIPAGGYDLHRVILESNYVQLAVALGDYRLAHARLLLCEEFSLKAATRRARLISSLARGLYEVHYGDRAKAVGILEHAVESAEPMSEEWRDGNLFLIRGLQQMGEPERALRRIDLLAEGWTRLCQRAVQALAEEHLPFAPAFRTDELDALAFQRSRLEARVAQREAAHARWEAIERLAMAAQLRTDSSGLHGHRVGKLSRLFAQHLRLQEEIVDQIGVAGRLHDIGKMALPEHVLNPTGAPSAAEREIEKTHARIGADLLAGSAIPELRCAEVVARHHHERWDGQGYPAKMFGKRIPVECRIVALADSLDAMMQGRHHARPLPLNVALGEIQIQRGKQFDPGLVDAFLPFVRGVVADNGDLRRFLESDAKGSPLSAAMRELADVIADAVPKPEEARPTEVTAPMHRERTRPSTEPAEPL